ncbi:hypothetical protein MMC30_003226 [Trapelia coarctata]|nr:hypothetical protein [Trapelia coarctata]
MDAVQQQVQNGTSNGGQTPATPVPAPANLGESSSIPPLELSSSVSPRSAKPAAVARLIPRGESDPDRTPTSAVHPSAKVEGSGVNGSDHSAAIGVGRDICFTPQSTLRGSSLGQIAGTTSISNASSPLHSGHASSTSFQSSQADNSSADGIYETNHRLLDGSSFTASPVSRTSSNVPADEDSSRPNSTSLKQQPSSHLRREGPHYPNQSFAALQSQYYPSPYEPHPLRTRSSHPSQNSFYSSTSSTKSRNVPSMTSGAKTAGNTPAQSPGLFNTSSSSIKYVGDDGQEMQYNTPMLHPSHLQAPKETHKLLKDIDPISGRKIVNNYEFQSKLGSGAHGTVKLGRNLLTDELVAIKIVRRFSKKLRLGKQESPEDKVKKEVAILKKARHPHVVSLLEVIDDPEFGKVYLILEYVELGEIVWRTHAEKHVAAFEMNRVKFEISGNLDETLEAELILQFNQDLKDRREEKHCLWAESHSQVEDVEPAMHNLTIEGISATTTGPGTFWSLEYGGDSEDEQSKAMKLHGKQHGAANDRSGSTFSEDHFQGLSRHGTHSRISTPIPDDSEGHMWDSFTMAKDDHLNYQASLDRTLSNQSHEAGTEEEFKYVPCLTLSHALDAFRDTVLGLEYLHYQGIIHRDIKPANLLWTADHRVKISDFGVSYLGRPIREDDNNEEKAEADSSNRDEAVELAKTVGTPAFYAPELCDPSYFEPEKASGRPQITGQIDVWALGVTLYGMVFGRLPFYEENEFAMYDLIAKQEVFIPQKRLKGVETNQLAPLTCNKRHADELEYEDVDDELRDLLKRLLEKKPLKRITLKEVKHHPWVLRGIKDQARWIDETDPSLQSQGKKIEVSTQEVNEAVAPLTIVDRIKSGIRRLGSVVRGRDSRKRAESNAKTSEPSVGDRQGRRTSLRGDEQIFSALRASRETTEHPLAQSLAASPELREDHSYFSPATSISEMMPYPDLASPKILRPTPGERSISTADSIKTIKPTVPTTVVRHSTPPPIAETLPTTTTLGDSAASSTSSLTGIFGEAGRRLVRSIRSRERGPDREGASQSSRSSSVENIASNFEDPHAPASIAFSSAMAAGHVDQPPIPADPPVIELQQRHSAVQSPVVPAPSYVDPFQMAQEQNYRRLMHEREQERDAAEVRGQRSRANTAIQCPPSPDDELAYEQQQRRQSETSQDANMAVSSSDDHMTSGISESFSHPSIPSVVSGASSLATTAEEQKADVYSSMMSTGQTITAASTDQLGKVHGSMTSDDEAGYNGDGDEEEEESDDDGGIMFGKK